MNDTHTNYTVKNKALRAYEVCQITQQYLTGGVLGYATIDSSDDLKVPVLLVRLAYNRTKTLLAKLPAEELKSHMAFQNEAFYHLLDKLTRESGKLIKVITIADLQGMSVFGKEFGLSYLRLRGEHSKRSMFLHPQMLGVNVVLNLPSSMTFLIKLGKKLFSKRVTERLKFCSAEGKRTSNRDDAAEKCPFVRSHGIGSILPSFIGGKAQCPAFFDFEARQESLKNKNKNEGS